MIVHKRVKQQAQMKDANYTCATGGMLSLFYESNTKLTWTEVFEKIIDDKNSRLMTSIANDTHCRFNLM